MRVKILCRPIIALLIVICVVTAFPVVAETNDGQKNKIAVYVSGRRDRAEKNVLRTFMQEALFKSGKYEAIERSERLLAQIDAEQEKQRSGAVDDSQISQLGKQSGVQYICVIDVVYIQNSFQISARILDVETAKVEAIGVTASRTLSTDDMRQASYELAGKILGDSNIGGLTLKDNESEVLIIGPGGISASGAITVLIDGESRGVMRGDGKLSLAVQNGTRHLSVRWQGDGTSSQLKSPIKFSAKKGKKAVFRVNMKTLDYKIEVVRAKG